MSCTCQLVKEIFLIGTLNVGLPSLDVYSDGATIVNYYRGYQYHPSCYIYEKLHLNQTCLEEIPLGELENADHSTWATLLLIPFLLNYASAWLHWYRVEKKKKFTWIACLLSFYPQWRAVGIIRELWRDTKSGLAKKRTFEREMSEAEVFLEAVPTTFIMSHIFQQSWDPQDYSDIRNAIDIGFYGYGFGLYRILSASLFWLSFFSSVTTASLGMAKILKVGVCKVLPEDGCCGGFFSPGFILIFLTCLWSLTEKAGIFNPLIPFSNPFRFSSEFSNDEPIKSGVAHTLPGLLTGTYFLWHDGIFKTFLSHPSLLLLPTFTCFTFESNIKKSCRKKSLPTKEVEIRFSMRATCYNILFSAIVLSVKSIFDFFSNAQVQGMIELMLSYQGVPHNNKSVIGWGELLLYAAGASLFSFEKEILRHFLVFSLFLMVRFNLCSFELGVYKPSAPRNVFVLDQRSKQVVEVEVEMIALQDSGAIPDEEEMMAMEAEIEDKV